MTINYKQNKTQANQQPNPYSSLTIQGFRSFASLKLNNLAKINLFLGPNNAGKTTILEAVYNHACGFNFMPFLLLTVVKRSDDILSGSLELGDKLLNLFWDKSNLPFTFNIEATLEGNTTPYKITSTFHPASNLALLDPHIFGQFAGTLPVNVKSVKNIALPQLSEQQYPYQTSSNEFVGTWQIEINQKSLNEQLSFELSFPPNLNFIPPFKVVNMHDLLKHRNSEFEIRVFSYLKRYKLLTEFTIEMQQAFPEISEIDMQPYPDGKTGFVYITTTNNQQIPLYAFGDGVRRWFDLLGHMIVNQNAIHCIEEIDATFHREAYQKLSQFLIRYANQYNNQLFITSHNIEFIDAFLETLYAKKDIPFAQKDPVRIFTIKPSNTIGYPEIWGSGGQEAFEDRQKYQLELRG